MTESSKKTRRKEKAGEGTVIFHPIEPVFDRRSRVLILGSFPSVKSREQGFFYGHPRNRFWQVTAAVVNEETPSTVPDKKSFLLRNRIALWDVIRSCEIRGSSDASIRNAVPNDLTEILEKADIRMIVVNGKTAEKLYKRHIEPVTGRSAIVLPSTSPANAAWSLERLTEAWSVIGEVIKDGKED